MLGGLGGGHVRNESNPDPPWLTARNYAYDDGGVSAPDLGIDGAGQVLGAMNLSRVYICDDIPRLDTLERRIRSAVDLVDYCNFLVGSGARDDGEPKLSYGNLP